MSLAVNLCSVVVSLYQSSNARKDARGEGRQRTGMKERSGKGASTHVDGGANEQRDVDAWDRRCEGKKCAPMAKWHSIFTQISKHVMIYGSRCDKLKSAHGADIL